MIDKEEFKAWLQHPCTKLFQNILKNKREEFYLAAAETAYNSYYKAEKEPHVTLLYGKCDGLDVACGMLESCQNQIKDELKYVDEPLRNVEDVIGDFLKEVQTDGL